MDRAIWTSALVGFLAPIVLFSPFNSSKAWVTSLLDQARGRQAVVQPSHPQVTIRTSARAPERRSHVTRVGLRKSKAAAPKAGPRPATPVEPFDAKAQLARTIDPNLRPDWYLIDPTIRRGDVLFLKNKVVVFKGSKIGDLKSYVPVSNSRLLTKKERRVIETLARRPSGDEQPVAARPAPAGLVSASAARTGATN